MYSIMSSANSDRFTFLSNLDSFYFLFFSSVARTSNTMLKEIVKSKHPCLIPHLRGKVFSFSAQGVILTGLPRWC